MEDNLCKMCGGCGYIQEKCAGGSKIDHPCPACAPHKDGKKGVVDLIPYEDLRYKHKSDCALHNAPAVERGDCDCNVALDILDEVQSMLRLKAESVLFPEKQMLAEIDWCFAVNHIPTIG